MTDKQNIEITPELLEEVRAAESAEAIVAIAREKGVEMGAEEAEAGIVLRPTGPVREDHVPMQTMQAHLGPLHVLTRKRGCPHFPFPPELKEEIMADKQLDNNNLESAIPENPEISDEQLKGATGGWNTKRKVYYVFCRECRSAYACYNDE